MAAPVLSNNPVFSGKNNPQTTGYGYGPGLGMTDTGVITVDKVINRSMISFGLLLAAAAVGWFFPILLIPGLIGGLVLGLVNAFKKEPSPPLILTYAAFEGAFVGAVSSFFERMYPGSVSQAVLGTFVVAAVVFVLFRFGNLRATARATKVWLTIMVAYLAFSLINFVLVATGLNTDPYGLRGSVTIFGIPLGIILGALAIVLAAYSLISDFTFVENAVQQKADQKYAWTAAFGIMVTMVWLYLEILRVIGLSRR